jgi:hypothetical protein
MAGTSEDNPQPESEGLMAVQACGKMGIYPKKQGQKA